MGKKAPRIPKFPKKTQTKQTTPTLISAHDFLDQGVEEEESGDRWIISDLSKSLRFYQKAYEYYIQAITKDDSLVDAYYNADRLLFHIWERYHALPNGVLKGIDGCDVHRYSLKEIKEKHEFVVRRFEDITWELYYNLVLINTELIESDVEELEFEEFLKICNDSVGLLERVLEYQLKELDSFLKRLENPEDDLQEETIASPGIPGDDDGNEDDQEEGSGSDYDVVEQVTPSSVLESVLTGAKLMEACYSNCDNSAQVNLLKTNFSSFELKLQEVLSLLFNKFTFDKSPDNPYNLNFQPEELQDIKLVNHSLEGFLLNDFQELIKYWDDSNLPSLETSSSRYLAESDSFNNFKDRSIGLSSQDHWILIKHINSKLKKAQELVKEELQFHINNKTNEVSSKVSKIVEILILRADNELMRSLFEDLESSVKNKEILRQNSINLLKNGMNMSNTNCGLRETISDKLNREKLKRECIIRLVLLTRDEFSESDLIRNLGADHYLREVEDLKSNELYKEYF